MLPTTRSSSSLALGLLALSACAEEGSAGAPREEIALDAGAPASEAGRPAPDAGSDASSRDVDASGPRIAIELRFQAKVGSEPLRCGATYPGLGSSQVAATPGDFRMFVERVHLLTKEGVEVPLQFEERAPFQTRDVALLDFTDGTGRCLEGAPSINTVIYGSAPDLAYDGVVLVHGVPHALNHGDPSLAPAPLQAPGAHWTWQSGYRFLMASLEPIQAGHGDAGASHDGGAALSHGDAGVSHDGGAALSHGDAGPSHGAGTDAGASHHGAGGGASAVHVGSTGCTGTPALGFRCESARPNRTRITLRGFDPTKRTIVADLAALFSQVDLRAGGQCHGMGPACVAPFAALGLAYETGLPSAEQTVFRVE